MELSIRITLKMVCQEPLLQLYKLRNLKKRGLARNLLPLRMKRMEVVMKLKIDAKEKERVKRELIRKLEATIRQAQTADAARDY